MTTHVRPLRADEMPAADRMSGIAFGYDPGPSAPALRPARTTWGAFLARADGDSPGPLVAVATDRHQQQWFGGRLVPASGVAGVVVEPYARGRGRAREVVTALLHGARERGAAVSTLYPTAPALYRSLGWERCGARTWHRVPVAALAQLRAPDGVVLRPASADDYRAVRHVYRTLAAQGNGLLDREGPLFAGTGEEFLAAFSGVTVATEGDEVVGYCSWSRGQGAEYDRLSAYDLLSTTAGGTRALLALLGSWASVITTVLVQLPDEDPAPLLVPVAGGDVHRSEPWMLRIVDAPAAVAARGWPERVRAVVDLSLTDPVLAANSGHYRLVIDGGEARLEPGGSGTVALAVGGLAVLYASAAGPAVLRRAGLLAGGGAAEDAVLAAAFAGPRPALLDHF